MGIIDLETAGALKKDVTFGTENNLDASYLLSRYLSGYIVSLEKTTNQKNPKETPFVPEKTNQPLMCLSNFLKDFLTRTL